jgi:hypothetical protein
MAWVIWRWEVTDEALRARARELWFELDERAGQDPLRIIAAALRDAVAGERTRIRILEEALGAIESACDEEICTRFGTSSHKTEEQIAGRSVIYSLLVVPRNIARAALTPHAAEEAQTKKPSPAGADEGRDIDGL